MLFNQPSPQVPLRAVAPPHAHRRIAPEKPIRRIIGVSAVERELIQARIAWRMYQCTRERAAAYDYLGAVFKIVCQWRRERRAKTSAHQALKVTGRGNRIRKVEPFTVVIFCSSDPYKVDGKTRSKWSRALQYCERFKPNTQNLAQFMKRHGGINECAARWSDQIE